MAKCSYCGTGILFGGKRTGEQRFCNTACQQRGALIALSLQVPDPVVAKNVWDVHQGRCPKCKGPGPVDVHTSYKVMSFLVLTRWSNTPYLSCRACGLKQQMSGLAVSLFLGWWGIPWGLIMTPLQIGRNLSAAFSCPDPAKPSPKLEKLVRVNIGAKAARSAAAARA